MKREVPVRREKERERDKIFLPLLLLLRRTLGEGTELQISREVKEEQEQGFFAHQILASISSVE